MIIWRGWGILAVLVLVLCIGGAAAIAGENDALFSNTMMPLGLIVAGVACWFLGKWLNRTRPQRQVEAYLTQRQEELRTSVEAGTFAPGGIRPTSLTDARAQAQALFEAERAELSRAGNQHTLFFIPIQYLGVLAAAAGVVLFVMGLFR